MRARLVLPGLGLAVLALAAWACGNLPYGPPPDSIATMVAATLTSLPVPATSSPTAAEASVTVAAPTPSLSASPSATTAPPPDGVSLNCDGSYQRVRLVDNGEAGRALVVDQWNGASWVMAWELEGGDPMIRQLQPEAGAQSFGGCPQLLLAPFVYTGSGAVLELHIFAWTGTQAVEVLHAEGTQGTWKVEGSRLRVERALYLYGEPNCCPCNRQTKTYEWNGVAFIESGDELAPTYTGTPPPMCIP